jgi:hypothetical protein
MNKSYTIVATLGNDLEQIIAADFLDQNELAIIHNKLSKIFDAVDLYQEFCGSMSELELDRWQEQNGLPDVIVPYPFFIFCNKKHRDLIAYLTVCGVGIQLSESEVPGAFERFDTINLLTTEL